MNESFRSVPNIVIAYHGCDQSISERVISGQERIKDSRNMWDWLGHGQYFWEHNLERAYEWAVELSRRKRSGIKTPSVIGAVIEHLHVMIKDRFGIGFDTVRGVFTEGQPLYSNAGFKEKTHIQLCVRNPECILGYFKPLNNRRVELG
jgi:hypothetical protein